MAVGQEVLAPVSGLAVTAALENALEAGEKARSAAHAAQLRQVLELHAVNTAAGFGVTTPAQLALVLCCSEWRGADLLLQAEILASLPEGLTAVSDGRLTVEQTATAARKLAEVPVNVRVRVWQALLEQLATDRAGAVIRPPRRLAELLDALILTAAPEEAVDRRQGAERDADVDYHRRDDGLVDLHAYGINAPTAHALLSRIRLRAQPGGTWDTRSAGQRRRDALIELVLGRRPFAAPPEESGGGCPGGACTCRPGAAVPCGAAVLVHVPYATLLGVSDVPAELVGHGPIEADLLQALLLNAPALQAVFIDEFGTPIATSEQVLRPERGDPTSVRQALLDLLLLRPGERFPRHPRDHDHDHDPPDHPDPPDAEGPPEDPAGPAPPSPPAHAVKHEHDHPVDPLADAQLLAAATLAAPGPSPARGPARDQARGRPHPPGQPGSYSIRPRLRRFLTLRAPRCEWPGCGARAARCDIDHDRAWPAGATCACNLGPLCRRHHRIKQTGWTKTRQADGSIGWTSPTGRTWTDPNPHPAPPKPTRPLPPVRIDAGTLSPGTLDQERHHPADPYWTDQHADPTWLQHTPDHDPDDHSDRLGELLLDRDSRWTLHLDDHLSWQSDPSFECQ